MKKLLLILIVICSLTCLISCEAKYTDSLTSKELLDLSTNNISTQYGVYFLEEDDGVLLDYSFDENETSYIEDCIVMKDKDTKNINEVGIFKIENGKTEIIKAKISEYVNMLQTRYNSMNYFPEEVEKIDFATVKVFGNYVVYSFLNEADTEAFYSAIENSIKK